MLKVRPPTGVPPQQVRGLGEPEEQQQPDDEESRPKGEPAGGSGLSEMGCADAGDSPR